MKPSADIITLHPKSVGNSANVLHFPIPRARYAYGENKRPNVAALATSIAIALLAITAVMSGHVPLPKVHSERLQVMNLQAPPPPPPPAAQPQPQETPKPQQIVLPPTPLPSQPDAPRIHAIVSAQPSPPPAAVSETASASPVTSAASPSPTPSIEQAGDLSASMISAAPPRYPQESRRKREQGTVVLSVLLDVDGSVASVSVAQSSGHARLDQAALSAVRRWRWSPTRRHGAAVQVKGVVEIPFVLQEK